MTRHSLGVAFRDGGAKAGQFLATRPDWFIERFAKIPTTVFMFMLVGYLSIRTQQDYHHAMMTGSDWEPSAEWLGFLLGLLTGAAYQWQKKRTTDHEYQRIQRRGPDQQAPPPPNGEPHESPPDAN